MKPSFLLITAAAALALCLPSCEALKGVPVRASVATDYGSVGYSSKRGLEVEVDQRTRK